MAKGGETTTKPYIPTYGEELLQQSVMQAQAQSQPGLEAPPGKGSQTRKLDRRLPGGSGLAARYRFLARARSMAGRHPVFGDIGGSPFTGHGSAGSKDLCCHGDPEDSVGHSVWPARWTGAA